MKAARYSEHGGPEVLRYEDVPDPAPGPADVVVRVGACALNRLDLLQRRGALALPGYRLPHIAGMDVAGEIVALGAEVRGLELGARVVLNPSLTEVRGDSRFRGLDDRYGLLGIIGATVDGGYAELCAAPASHVHRIPERISTDEAACLPTCFVTAWHALFAVGRLEAGETLLLHAAASGVSSAAIQIAKRAGARVLATASTAAKLDYARRLGADHVLVNRDSDVAAWARDLTGGRGVDLVFDHVGPAFWQASLSALRPRGRLITCGSTSGSEAGLNLAYLYHMGLRILGCDPYRHEEFAQALAQYWQGGYRPMVDSVFPLAEAAAAQRKMEAGEVMGKILLRP
jgi:NADPH:quinone reductase-like Zn-dependent oxidoreductase